MFDEVKCSLLDDEQKTGRKVIPSKRRRETLSISFHVVKPRAIRSKDLYWSILTHLAVWISIGQLLHMAF